MTHGREADLSGHKRFLGFAALLQITTLDTPDGGQRSADDGNYYIEYGNWDTMRTPHCQRRRGWFSVILLRNGMLGGLARGPSRPYWVIIPKFIQSLMMHNSIVMHYFIILERRLERDLLNASYDIRPR